MIGGEKYTLSDIEYLIFQMIPKQNCIFFFNYYLTYISKHKKANCSYQK